MHCARLWSWDDAYAADSSLLVWEDCAGEGGGILLLRNLWHVRVCLWEGMLVVYECGLIDPVRAVLAYGAVTFVRHAMACSLALAMRHSQFVCLL